MNTLVKQQATEPAWATICRIHDNLAAQTDLSPRNAAVNENLRELVRFVTVFHGNEAAESLSTLNRLGITSSLRSICQKAEYQLELYYSVPALWLNFPYVDHYLELAMIERDLAKLTSSSKVAFVGGGPLPWTVIAFRLILARSNRAVSAVTNLMSMLDSPKESFGMALANLMENKYWRAADNDSLALFSIEREEKAANQARAVLTSYELDDKIKVIVGDGSKILLPPELDTFFIASMVEEKEHVIRNIMSQVEPGKEVVFLIRSVDKTSLRCLLYEPCDDLLAKMEANITGFQHVRTFLPAPGSRLINSVLCYRYRNSMQS